MTRFLAGLSLGAIAAGTVLGATGSKFWTVLAAAVTTVGIWTWPLIRAELTT